MKKLYVLLCFLLFSASILSYADSNIHVTINGENLEMSTPPVVVNNRTLVPLRSIFEALGVTPEWDPLTKTVSAKSTQTSISLTIGSSTALINDRPVDMDTPGTLINGHTMVPARFIAEAFGAAVRWDASSQTVIINSSDKSNAAPSVIWTPETVSQYSIAAGTNHTAALKSDGTALAIGRNTEGQCALSNWKNLIAIAAGDFHTVGLCMDGTVVATGTNLSGQCNIGDWEDITAISAGASHTVGIHKDGTVVAVGSNTFSVCNVSTWSNIIAISASSYQTVGLKRDGRVVVSTFNKDLNVSGWRDIVAVSAGAIHTVGLKRDGTVVAVGDNRSGACNVSEWEDIVAVTAGFNYTLGLKKDGTVVYSGSNLSGACNVQNWSDIVSISAGNNHSVGLKSDGTLVATGYDDNGKTKVSVWAHIGRVLETK